MKISEFRALKVGDKVTVRAWDEMKDEYGLDEDGNVNTPNIRFTVNMRQYCGKSYAIGMKLVNNCILNDDDGDALLGMFAPQMLECMIGEENPETPAEEKQAPRENGEPDYNYLTYAIPIQKERHMRRAGVFFKQAVCGKIGEPTKLKDSNGEPLFIGDVVTVYNNDLETCCNVAPITRTREYGAIVCGIASDYCEKNITDEWRVIKSIDWSAVRDGAVVNNVRYNVRRREGNT